MRKTMHVNRMIDSANSYLAYDGSTSEERSLLFAFVTGLLQDNNSYNGFGYQSSELQSDGIHLREGYDRTRTVITRMED